jgi:hypothetical protein
VRKKIPVERPVPVSKTASRLHAIPSSCATLAPNPNIQRPNRTPLESSGVAIDHTIDVQQKSTKLFGDHMYFRCGNSDTKWNYSLNNSNLIRQDSISGYAKL